MDKTILNDLIKSYDYQAGLYRSLADQACTDHQAFDVYQFIKEHMSCMNKVRQIQNRYSHILQGK